MSFRTDLRAACVQLLTDYKTDANIKLQVYPGRPRSIAPPTAFVDTIREAIAYSGPTQYQRTPTAEVIVLHALFDSKEAVDQADAFVDGFLEWVVDRYDAADENTTIGITEVDDDPTYVPDWLPPAEQKTYYATRISVEGYAGI